MMTFALAVLAKATVIMLAALAVTRLARRTRAAVRHVLLAATFAVLLALPLASLAAPAISVALPMPVPVPVAAPRADTSTDVDLSDMRAARGRPVVAAVSEESRWPSRPALIAGTWTLGAALFLAPVAAGLWEVRRLRRSGLPWRRGQTMVDALTDEAAIGRGVDLLIHERVAGPVTCGIVRPAILLPIDAQRWDGEDLRRAIVHELEHVRRGDWLIQAVALGAAALYWFHPLVWVAWRELTLEAERACDDAVLQNASTALGAAGEPTAYADQLVHLAERLSASSSRQVLAMASRHDLSARVRAVLDSRQARGRAGAVAVALTAAVAALLAAAISPLRIVASEQTAIAAASDARVAFEVASVRPKGPFRGPAEVGVSFQPGGRVVAVNAPIYLLIAVAYGVSEKQVDLKAIDTNLMQEVFDIEASAGVNALPESAPREARSQQLRQMLQSLLAERFTLTIHKETKDTPLYALTVAPGGPRLKASPTGRSCPAGERCGKLGGGPASGVRGLDVEIEDLASTLTSFGDRQVLDRTGLKGKFDIDLPSWNRSSMFGPSEPNGRERAESPDDPSIFELLPRRLGLRLESIHGPVDTYVVDHVARPREQTPNAAQPAAAQKFAVATMKPCTPVDPPPNAGARGRGGAGGNVTASPGVLTIDCMTVQNMIDRAYVFFGEPLLNEIGAPQENTPRVKGGPAWMRSEPFTLEAKADGDADRKTLMGPMLRAFLEERLQLKLHRDTEEMPAYALTLTRGGPKLKALAGDADCKPECGSVQRGVAGGKRILELGGMELEILVTVLKLDRRVIDRTGIPDSTRFNIHLEYPDEAANETDRTATIARALEQQLGLKLEPIKAPHGILVIDRLVRP